MKITSKLKGIAFAAGLPFAPTYGGSSVVYNTGGTPSQIHNANDLITRLASLGDVAVYLLVALAVLYIVYSSVRYFVIGKEGDESRREAGMRIFWGILGLFIIVSLWGLVSILFNTFPTYNEVPSTNFPSANFVQQNGH